MKTKDVVLTGVLTLLVILAIAWAVQGNDFFMYKVFAPKYEEVRRETFENTRSYRQGMVQELQNMQFEYVKATPEQQKALAPIILHRAADFDLDQPDVPQDLRDFIRDLKDDKTKGEY